MLCHVCVFFCREKVVHLVNQELMEQEETGGFPYVILLQLVILWKRDFQRFLFLKKYIISIAPKDD